MTRKKSGRAKDEIIRIHKDDRIDLNFIKGTLGMNERKKEGDVVHELIQLFKQKKIVDPSFPNPRKENNQLSYVINEYNKLKAGYEGLSIYCETLEKKLNVKHS